MAFGNWRSTNEDLRPALAFGSAVWNNIVERRQLSMLAIASPIAAQGARIYIVKYHDFCRNFNSGDRIFSQAKKNHGGYSFLEGGRASSKNSRVTCTPL
jgi:hypothetical protein